MKLNLGRRMLDKIAHILDKAFCVDNHYSMLYHLHYKRENYQKVYTHLFDVIKTRYHFQ
jgi:hypothetical protein